MKQCTVRLDELTVVCKMSKRGRDKKNVRYSARNEMYALELHNYWEKPGEKLIKNKYIIA